MKRCEPYARFLIYVWAYEQGEGSRRSMGTAKSITTGETRNSSSKETERERVEEEKVQDVLVPWVLQHPPSSSTSRRTDHEVDADCVETKVYHRYYHLFTEGELRDLVCDAAREEDLVVIDSSGQPVIGPLHEKRWLRVRDEGWEADNWWLEAEVGYGALVDMR